MTDDILAREFALERSREAARKRETARVLAPLGLTPCERRHCDTLDELYAELATMGERIAGCGVLPDGRVVVIAENFWIVK